MEELKAGDRVVVRSLQHRGECGTVIDVPRSGRDLFGDMYIVELQPQKLGYFGAGELLRSDAMEELKAEEQNKSWAPTCRWVFQDPYLYIGGRCVDLTNVLGICREQAIGDERPGVTFHYDMESDTVSGITFEHALEAMRRVHGQESESTFDAADWYLPGDGRRSLPHEPVAEPTHCPGERSLPLAPNELPGSAGTLDSPVGRAVKILSLPTWRNRFPIIGEVVGVDGAIYKVKLASSDTVIGVAAGQCEFLKEPTPSDVDVAKRAVGRRVKVLRVAGDYRNCPFTGVVTSWTNEEDRIFYYVIADDDLDETSPVLDKDCEFLKEPTPSDVDVPIAAYSKIGRRVKVFRLGGQLYEKCPFSGEVVGCRSDEDRIIFMVKLDDAEETVEVPASDCEVIKTAEFEELGWPERSRRLSHEWYASQQELVDELQIEGCGSLTDTTFGQGEDSRRTTMSELGFGHVSKNGWRTVVMCERCGNVVRAELGWVEVEQVLSGKLSQQFVSDCSWCHEPGVKFGASIDTDDLLFAIREGWVPNEKGLLRAMSDRKERGEGSR